MNAIQTYWISGNSVPAGGWINRRFEYISWSLSFFLLKRNFAQVHLYGNTPGVLTLSEELGLKYDKVFTCLDTKEEQISDLWTMAKIYVYSLQETPFVHVDGDVFWFNFPPKDFLSSEVVAQCLEIGDPFYHDVLKTIRENHGSLPAYWDKINLNSVFAINMGILGGHHVQLFKKFYDEALNFYHENLKLFKKHSSGSLKYLYIFIEQFFFSVLARENNASIKLLKKTAFKNDFSEVLNFNKVLPSTGEPDFLHLLGSYKYRLNYCNKMEFWLKKLWPAQLQKIDACFNAEITGGAFLRLNPENEKRLPLSKWIYNSPEEVFSDLNQRSSTLYSQLGDEDSAEFQKYRDCLDFESKRKQVLEVLLDEKEDAVFQHFESHNRFCSKPFEEIRDLTVELNESKLVKSRNNWFNNLEYKSKNYWYHLIVDTKKTCFQEFLFSEPDCKILDLMSHPITINDLKCMAEEKTDPRVNLHEILKSLFGEGVIKVSPQTHLM